MSKRDVPGKLLDGKEASRIVRDYFVEIHGTYFVWNFQVESATPEGRNWKIRCSFAPSLAEGAPRSTYEVEVKESGTVGQVKRINAPSSR